MSDIVELATASRIFMEQVGGRLRDNESETIPVPVRREGSVELLVMVYRSTPFFGQPSRPAPPHAAARLDARTGALLHFGPCAAAELGITDVDQRPWPAPVEMVPGATLWAVRPRLEARLEEIAPSVYGAFASRTPATPALRDLAREHYYLMKELVSPAVSPFYDQAARELFDWLRATSTPPVRTR